MHVIRCAAHVRGLHCKSIALSTKYPPRSTLLLAPPLHPSVHLFTRTYKHTGWGDQFVQFFFSQYIGLHVLLKLMVVLKITVGACWAVGCASTQLKLLFLIDGSPAARE